MSQVVDDAGDGDIPLRRHERLGTIAAVPFHTHVPPPPLRPFIAVAHGYGVPANPAGVHRGLPSRYLMLVVELHAPRGSAGAGG